MNVSSARGVIASGTFVMLDGYGAAAGIMITYGHASACSVLRGRGTAQLLAGRGAARGHPACGEPADPVAREAPRPPAPRPFGTPGRADRRRPAALPERAQAARPGGAASRGARRGGRGRAGRPPRARSLDRA